MIPTEFQVLGKDNHHLVPVPECGGAVRLLLPAASAAFEAMRQHCRKEGIELAIASSYRSYEQQLNIWNEKYTGKRPLLDKHGHALDVSQMAAIDKVFAILTWSAIPGASRHHWGSDLDVYDLAAMPAGYQLQLIPEEYDQGGPFEKLGVYLDFQAHLHGFTRPYLQDGKGVAFEPWHISFAKSANVCRQVLTAQMLMQHISNSNILGREVILENFAEIWQRFIVC